MSDIERLRAELDSTQSELIGARSRIRMNMERIRTLEDELASERAGAGKMREQLAAVLFELERNTIQTDSYGVLGSDFYICAYCNAESGAGVLNTGIPHESDCILFTAREALATDAGRETLGDTARLISRVEQVANKMRHSTIGALSNAVSDAKSEWELALREAIDAERKEMET